jgi:hypothetical protein
LPVPCEPCLEVVCRFLGQVASSLTVESVVVQPNMLLEANVILCLGISMLVSSVSGRTSERCPGVVRVAVVLVRVRLCWGERLLVVAGSACLVRNLRLGRVRLVVCWRRGCVLVCRMWGGLGADVPCS